MTTRTAPPSPITVVVDQLDGDPTYTVVDADPARNALVSVGRFGLVGTALAAAAADVFAMAGAPLAGRPIPYRSPFPDYGPVFEPRPRYVGNNRPWPDSDEVRRARRKAQRKARAQTRKHRKR